MEDSADRTDGTRGEVRMIFEEYSVLMSVYYKENADFLKQSMESILRQTVPTDDFVLVCDGPLTEELDAVIERMQDQIGEILRVVRLKKNGGLGKALNEGLKYCKHEIVARMDSDDISLPDRCEKQLLVFKKDKRIDICSGTVSEFILYPEIPDALRVVPETQEEIIRFAKWRNPFNHPCVMYKKSAVQTAGGYQDFYLLEDYYLWIRMILNGSQGYNIQEVLLHMRAGEGMYKRRGGMKYAKSQIRLLRFMYESGLIKYNDFLLGGVLRGTASILPNTWRKSFYKSALRE